MTAGNVHRPGDLSWRVKFHGRTNGKNNIGTLRVSFPIQPKGLPDYSFDSISLYGPSDLPVHTYSKPAESELVGAENQGKTWARPAFSLLIDLFKLQPAPQQMGLSERKHHFTIRPTAASVPWPGEHLIWHDRQRCSCVRENHVSVFV